MKWENHKRPRRTVTGGGLHGSIVRTLLWDWCAQTNRGRLLEMWKKQELREFGATTEELRSLTEWLSNNDCQMITMESTESYWEPLYNIFELFALNAMVVNASDMRNYPRSQDKCQGYRMDCGSLSTFRLQLYSEKNASFIYRDFYRFFRDCVLRLHNKRTIYKFIKGNCSSVLKK